MSQMLTLSDDTYQQFTTFAERHHRTPDEMLRLCMAAYETTQSERMHAQMVAEGLLVTLPTPSAVPDDDFEPEDIPGKPVSEIILEDRI